ncbi:PBS lyase HEAT domain protein repeat-containing protein [Thalassoporum mexicanum PCC 7367]|uniref:HEAT repeat domain-containing protein n=1 Tax=Thalassoporum mexicanum TaxID=3457544 RepID=UPI00029F906F|nr:HEAT repeat domain-containing protein [Pseudanabaena sp. PCC 7367]AFY69287.1 PBS lyase HEAT domain protein repeat-containing protein [Pseudanabaena sp. PCC 7367]
MIDDEAALLDDIDQSFSSPLDQPEEELPRPDPEEMLVLLDSSTVLERMQAARAFCEIEDDRAIPKLISLLQDDCTLVRVSAAYALGRNSCAAAVPHLISLFDSEWNGYVRKGVVWALGNCRDRQALQPLISALKYDIPAVRLWAASALGQLDDIAAIEPLTAALENDKLAVVKSNCAWSLGKLLLLHRNEVDDEVYQEAIDVLINAMFDDDLGVAEDARVALHKLGDPRALKVIERIDNDRGYCDLVP